MTKDSRFDLDIQKRDLLDLATADGVAAFFTNLRYDTSKRTVQTPVALGLTEAVARPIRRIEMLADHDLLQVYFVELTSVTIKATRDLVRSFRDRAGNFLFVLTNDYQRLDFVLLDRLPADVTNGGITTVRQPVRPRILTVERRNPSTVALRVLRRFTWTENDGFAQFEKVRSAYALGDWSEEEGLFNNRALFSDHYLKSRLREDPSWSADATPVIRSFRDLFLNRKQGGRAGESVSSLLEPTFSLLGFHAVAIHRDPGEGAKADYELFAEPGDEMPIALALTYPWERYLDGKDETRDPQTPNENPGSAVVSLLQNRDVPWVIVTNGKLWRLYAKRTHSRATSYYEIDVEEALADASTREPDAFRYFWLMFRRQAFEMVTLAREDREEQVPFLDRLLLESEDYAKELGERLKERVFEHVFPYLASGFVSRWDGQPSEDDLTRTYRATLTLLYRLLFLLYSEARDLLPVREVRGYFSKSLERLKKDVAEKAGSIEEEIDAALKKAYAADSSDLYTRLSELFAIIDDGNADLNVPLYNGGLFSTSPCDDDETDEAEAARFLRDHSIPDRHLAAAIDLLARDTDPRTHERVFVDYKSLGVRHLGSIYEGLLEFQLRFATERLGIVREKSRDVYKSWRDLDERKKERLERDGRFVKRGQLYLENDKHERKATGSYYTPDHIVKYIVEHAVGPVVAEKLEELRPQMRKAQQWRKEAPAVSKAKGETVDRNYEWGPVVEGEWKTLIDDVFNIKVLDPAMGSGHFLVEAVDYITDRILDFLNKFPWNPVTAHLRSTRETILKEMEKQGISIDPAKLTDVNLLKRHVLKRCIYGVDLNPMAVELAKVSLWLDCFTLGAPLSFLDHHLRCGNSLVGVTIEEVESRLREGTQQTFFFSGNKFEGLKQSVAAMIHIGDLSDITAAQVKESREEYRRASDVLRPAKRLLDVYTSQWFGNEPVSARGHADVNPALDFLGDKVSEVWAYDPIKTKLGDSFRHVVDIATTASAENHFFHWQLEFPEVFFKRRNSAGTFDRVKDGGFDAVVGNPPFDVLEKDRGQEIWPHERLLKYVRAAPALKDATGGKINLYRPFVVRALSLTRRGGSYIQILPMSFMADVSVTRTRASVLSHYLEAVIAFPQKDEPGRRVFREAKLSTCVPVVRCHVTSSKQITITTYPWDSFDDEARMCALSREDVRLLDPEALPLPSCSQPELDLALALHRGHRRLKDVASVTRGEINQTTFRRFITLDPNDRPLLKGVEIRRFGFNETLRQGEREFFDEKAFEKQHSSIRPPQQRIATQRISGVDDTHRLECALSTNSAYFADSTNAVIPRGDASYAVVLAFLNSDLLDWRFKITSTNNNVGTAELEMLPFPKVVADEVAKRLERIVAQLNQGSTDSARVNDLIKELNGCVRSAFSLSD